MIKISLCEVEAFAGVFSCVGPWLACHCHNGRQFATLPSYFELSKTFRAIA
jgi:hypothetical protein